MEIGIEETFLHLDIFGFSPIQAAALLFSPHFVLWYFLKKIPSRPPLTMMKLPFFVWPFCFQMEGLLRRDKLFCLWTQTAQAHFFAVFFCLSLKRWVAGGLGCTDGSHVAKSHRREGKKISMKRLGFLSFLDFDWNLLLRSQTKRYFWFPVDS